jgi:hypothetical protein
VNTTAATVPTVTLTNNQAIPLTITAISTTGDFAVNGSTCPLSPNTLAAGVACTISVSRAGSPPALPGDLKSLTDPGVHPENS